MKSPTSIVNTLLESDYVDYDSNLDPFSDPKNFHYDSLGYAHVSKGDLWSRVLWTQVLRDLGLIPQEISFSTMTPEYAAFADTVYRVYVDSVAADGSAPLHLWPNDLTEAAKSRIEGSLGPVGPSGFWPVRVVHVAYK